MRSIQHVEGNMQPLIWGLGEISGSNVERRVPWHAVAAIPSPVRDLPSWVCYCRHVSRHWQLSITFYHVLTLSSSECCFVLAYEPTHSWRYSLMVDLYLPWSVRTSKTPYRVVIIVIQHACSTTHARKPPSWQPQYVTCHRSLPLLPHLTCPSHQWLHAYHHHRKHHHSCFSFRTTIWSQLMAIPVDPVDIRSGIHLTIKRQRSILLAQTMLIGVQMIKL